MAAGADAVKVSIGPGSICTTRIVAGVGVPQLTAIHNVSEALKSTGVPDCRRRYPLLRRYCPALAAGAYSVMLGGMFADAEEAPGEIEDSTKAALTSLTAALGSLGAIGQGSADRYFKTKPTVQTNMFLKALKAAFLTKVRS